MYGGVTEGCCATLALLSLDDHVRMMLMVTTSVCAFAADIAGNILDNIVVAC